MPFDDDLVLIDGTIVIDSDVAAGFAVATSTTRATATGAAVIDLGEAGTGVKGLAAVLIIPALTSSTDYLTAVIQVSDEVAFGNAVHYLHEACKFDIAAVTTGRILASECGSIVTVIQRFWTDKRYVRAYIVPTKGNGDGSFSYVQVLLSPYPYLDL